MKYIGTKIKELRKLRQLSAQNLAEMIGKEGENAAQFIYDIESGRTKRLGYKVLKGLSDTFEVEIDYLVNDEIEEVIRKSDNISSQNNQDEYMIKYIELLEEFKVLQTKYAEALEDNARITNECWVLKFKKTE